MTLLVGHLLDLGGCSRHKQDDQGWLMVISNCPGFWAFLFRPIEAAWVEIEDWNWIFWLEL